MSVYANYINKYWPGSILVSIPELNIWLLMSYYNYVDFSIKIENANFIEL